MANRDTHIGAVGNHADTPAASFTRSSATAAYASGELIANSTTAASVAPLTFAAARDADIAACVRRARIKCSDGQFLNQTVRLHLYRGNPCSPNPPANGDGGTWSTYENDYLGAIDVTFDKQFTDPMVKGIGTPNNGSEITFLPASGTTAIYGLIECRSAIAAPAASSTWQVTLELMQN